MPQHDQRPTPPPTSLSTADFDYALPPELIAQAPAARRDDARLLVVHRDTGGLEHRRVADLPDYLRAGDALALNDTRVLPARLLGHREGSGGAVELLLLREEEGPDTWRALVRPGRRLAPGARVALGDGSLSAEIGADLGDGQRLVRLTASAGAVGAAIERLGVLPLPPYIHGYSGDQSRYQTVYARVTGSAAAPTAGLHFTPELLEQLRQQGVREVYLTLHVGLGTFRPVAAELIAEHRLHAEWADLSAGAATTINSARAAGGRCVAVGTTSARTLETAADQEGQLHPFQGETDLFIYPGYRFKALDALLTNFHLPRSSLLMLVSAFAGLELTRHAYAVAVDQRYRFFSFGDAMLIL